MSLHQRIHDKLGTAGLIVAVCALVLSLLGGAYAATNSARHHKKAKKGVTLAQVKKIAKTEAKKYANSNPGAPGTNGANGTNGKDGANGAPGEDGEDGRSVSVGTASGAECEFGGATVELESTPASKKAVCNGEPGEPGEDGEPWTAGGTLPTGATETGTYAAQAMQDQGIGPFHLVFAPISFSVPLSSAQAAATTAVYVPDENTTTEHCSAAPINGTPLNPKAESGYLCVYGAAVLTSSDRSGSFFTISSPDTLGFNVPGPSGAFIEFKATSATLPMIANGSWAVTG